MSKSGRHGKMSSSLDSWRDEGLSDALRRASPLSTALQLENTNALRALSRLPRSMKWPGGILRKASANDDGRVKFVDGRRAEGRKRRPGEEGRIG